MSCDLKNTDLEGGDDKIDDDPTNDMTIPEATVERASEVCKSIVPVSSIYAANNGNNKEVQFDVTLTHTSLL